MSIDKWIHKDPETAEEKKLRNEIYKNLSKEEKKDLKQQKIRDIVSKDEKEEKLPAFLDDILEFTTVLKKKPFHQTIQISYYPKIIMKAKPEVV